MNLSELFSITKNDGSVQVIEGELVEGAWWYRYTDHPGYEWDSPTINLRQLRVIRETPKGVWLDDWSVPRFVLNNARKRFAYPTIELARESFIKRKRHQVGHLSRQHDHAVAVLKKAEEVFA